MVTFIARLKALPGKEAEAVKQVKEMVMAVQEKEPGTLAYISHTVPGSPGEFLFFEVYADAEAASYRPAADEAAKDAHVATPHFQKLAALIGPVFDASFGVKIENLDRVGGCVRS
jgi:quinol monooxygenase YgiN